MVKFWNSCISEWEGRLTLHKEGVSRSFMTMTVTIWWPRSGVWIFQIVTGVTSVVGVPSTHLVSVKFPSGEWKKSYLWWLINISGNGLVPSGSKPLPEPMLTKLFGAIWRHNELTCSMLCHIYKQVIVYLIISYDRHFVRGFTLITYRAIKMCSMAHISLSLNGISVSYIQIRDVFIYCCQREGLHFVWLRKQLLMAW